MSQADALVAEMLRLEEDAMRDKRCIVLEHAFDGELAKHWKSLRERMRRHLSERPS